MTSISKGHRDRILQRPNLSALPRLEGPPPPASVATGNRALTDSPLRTTSILFALWLLVFTSASQTIIVTPILPLIGAELSVPAGRLGLLISVYSWVLAMAALVMGPISDRIGRRRVLLIGSGALALALALHGFVDSFGSLLLMRALAGAAGGMLSGGAVSYVGDYFSYERRGWATGIVMSGVPFGLIIGIPLGRMVAVGYGFRMPFLAFALVMTAAYLFMVLFLPQPEVERAADRPTIAGSLRQYAQLLRAPDTAAAAAVYFVMYLGLGLLVVYLPQWLTEQFALDVSLFGRPLALGGMPVDFIASLFFSGGVASVLVGPKAGRISDTVGRKPLILISCIGLAFVTVSLTYAITERWIAYPLYILIMALFAMRMAPLQALLTALVPGRQRGAFLSLTIALGQIGTGLGATLGGTLYGIWGYRSNTFASTVFILLMAVLVWRFLPEPTEDATDPVAILAD